MKKKIVGGAIIIFVFSLAIFIGFKIGISKYNVYDYVVEKGYAVFSPVQGIVINKEAAEKIGDAILIEKNIRGDKHLNVTYDAYNGGVWVVNETNNDDKSDVVTSVIIHRFGRINVVTRKK